jgi:hypothetical protein
VQPIDRIAPVREARADDQHIVVVGRRECAERARNQRRHLRAKQAIVRDVAGVTRISARAVGRVPQLVVVIGDGHERGRAVEHDGTAPLHVQCGHRVVHE